MRLAYARKKYGRHLLMTAFLTNVFKQAELARLRAAEDPALTQITYIFAHDEPLHPCMRR